MAQNNAGRSGRKGRGSGVLRQGASSPQALTIRFDRQLRAHRGKLEQGPGPGTPVSAASFLPRREVVLDCELLSNAPELVNIFSHEIYHFVWRRLPNAERKSWADLLSGEKRPLHPGLSSRLRFLAWRENEKPSRWKDYVCEAFCDTAAGLTDPNSVISPHRRGWFGNLMKKRKLPV